MRALVAGRPATLAEVTFAVENAHGTLPGTVGRVDNAFDALDLLDGTPAVLFLEVRGADDPQLSQIRVLRTRGARVVVLAKEASAELRVAALKAGARDVIFAPWTPLRVQTNLASALSPTGSFATGASVDYRAIVLPEGTEEQIPARVTRFSSAGLTIDTGAARALPREAIIRIAIQVPPPHQLPVLFARCTSDSKSGTATLRFVGLTADEEAMLNKVIGGTLSALVGAKEPAPVMTASVDVAPTDATSIARMDDLVNPAEAQAAIGRVIADIDGSVLREAPNKWLGHILPVLTDAERISLVDGSPLAEVAVWRTRAHVIASILEGAPQLATMDLPFAEWREGLAHARGLIRSEVTHRMADGDPGIVREAREVQARLNAVSDRIDRLAREAGLEIESDGGPLEAPLGPATFDRPAVPAPSTKTVKAEPLPPSGSRRLRAIVLGFLAVAAIAGLVGLRQMTQARRTTDIGRTGVAQRPIKEVAGVRVRSIFRDSTAVTVIVVDRSWYDRGHSATPESARDAARLLAQAFAVKGRVTIRDYAGRTLVRLADADSDSAPVTPLAIGSAGTPAPAATSVEPGPAESPAEARPSPRPPSPKGKKSGRAPASPSR